MKFCECTHCSSVLLMLWAFVFWLTWTVLVFIENTHNLNTTKVVAIRKTVMTIWLGSVGRPSQWVKTCSNPKFARYWKADTVMNFGNSCQYTFVDRQTNFRCVAKDWEIPIALEIVRINQSGNLFSKKLSVITKTINAKNVFHSPTKTYLTSLRAHASVKLGTWIINYESRNGYMPRDLHKRRVGHSKILLVIDRSCDYPHTRR